MAQKVIVDVVDDIDGSPDALPVEFSLDGTNYEIDLNEANAERLRNALAEFVDAARRTGGRIKRAPVVSINGRKPATADPEQKKDMRRWARENGYEISDRGRIPKEIMDAYQEALAVKPPEPEAAEAPPKSTRGRRKPTAAKFAAAS